MDPKTGRFITPDPIQDYLNQYSYVGNNPVNRIDPTGMKELPDEDYKATQSYGFFGDDPFWLDKMDPLTRKQYIQDLLAESIDREIEKMIKENRDDWRKLIESDGAITIDEAVFWYRFGNGEPLHGQLRFVDLSKVHAYDFPNGIGSEQAICLSPGCGDCSSLSDGLVYGSLTLILQETDEGIFFVTKAEDKAGNPVDRFNFEWHEINFNDDSWPREFARNIGTKLTDWHLRLAYGRCRDFDIYLRGRAYIYP